MPILKGLILGFTLLVLSVIAYAQASNPSSAPKYYLASAGETIFSFGIVGSDSSDLSPVVRFSPVFNLQEQLHYDFNDRIGIYTGLGIRNIGLISHYNDLSGNTEKIKERAYSLGLPLAFKTGNLKGGSNFAFGAEAELMFAYKRKIIEGDHKNRIDGWFNENVNIFNPSIFTEVKFQKGEYIRAKYYLRNFLNYKGITLIDGELLSDYGPKSPLFYISFGTVTLKQKLNKSSATSPVNSAFFRSRKSDFYMAANNSPLKN